MGCFSDLVADVPPEVKEILETVGTKCPDIVNSFVIKAQSLDKDKAEMIDERHTKVDEADKSDKKKLEEILLEYNKKEVENEKELILNEVEKMRAIYELGLELADKLKEITLKQLKEKLNKAPEMSKALINRQIDEVNNYSSKEFLFSPYGKPLKNALEKQGMREDELKDFTKKLEKERKERRKKERDEFKLDKNEFPPEDDLVFNVDDLYKAIFDEYKSEFKSQIASKIFKAVTK